MTPGRDASVVPDGDSASVERERPDRALKWIRSAGASERVLGGGERFGLTHDVARFPSDIGQDARLHRSASLAGDGGAPLSGIERAAMMLMILRSVRPRLSQSASISPVTACWAAVSARSHVSPVAGAPRCESS